MKVPSKTKQELIEEISGLKKKNKKLERSDAKCRREEQVLTDRNYKFLNLAANIPGYIAYVNANTLQYEFVNDMFEKAFSIPREQIIGSNIRDVIGEEKYQFALRYIDEARSGKSVSYESVFDLVSGKRWIQVNYSPVMDANGRVTSIAVLSYDITERKQTEELSIHE